MRKVFAVVALAALVVSGQAVGCEKWKSEIGETVFYIGSYISAYHKYTSSKISKSQLAEKSDGYIEKLRHIRERVKSIESCEDSNDKFKKRQNALRDALRIAIPTMKGGEFLAEEVKTELKRHEAG